MLLKIHCNTVLPFTPRSSKRLLSQMLYHQNVEYIHLSPMRAICRAHLIFHLITLIIFFTLLQPFIHKLLMIHIWRPREDVECEHLSEK